MAKNSRKMPDEYLPWIKARRRFQLCDAHIQMARELGLNPKKSGGLANTKQEPWKLPLPEFIQERKAREQAGHLSEHSGEDPPPPQ